MNEREKAAAGKDCSLLNSIDSGSLMYQPSSIAPVGHTLAQVPQLMQLSASIS